MITAKARIGKIPRLLQVYFKLAWPLSLALVILYGFEIHLISEPFHRIFMLVPILTIFLIKKFSHLLLKKETVSFCKDSIEIEERNISLFISEIESAAFTVSGYKGEVSYRGAKPSKMNGHGNILDLQLTEGEPFSMNILIEDPNIEVTLTKYLSGLPNCTIQRLR